MSGWFRGGSLRADQTPIVTRVTRVSVTTPAIANGTAWKRLIRRFIDPEAVIRYTFEPEPNDITFDMDGAEFGHVGNLCTFETTSGSSIIASSVQS